MKFLEIAIDFDGTCVEHKYPEIGREIPYALQVLREITDRGHKIILWTMRSEQYLEEAVRWYEERKIPLYGINSNPTQHTWTSSKKAYAQIYIDDAALGCPLIQLSKTDRPYVDWLKVRKHLFHLGVL